VLAEHYVRASDAADPVVVTTPNASGRIDERVEAADGRVERVRLGALHEGIAAARAGGGEVVFAGEPWKHVHTRLGPWIDGVASAAVLSVLVADRGLDALREPVTERPYRKVSVDCPDDRKVETMERLATGLPESFPEADVETEHGVRLSFEDGSWTLVRPSGTEPYVRVYAESESVDALVDSVVDAVERAVDRSGA
jgi:phosphomannomutase